LEVNFIDVLIGQLIVYVGGLMFARK